MYNHAINKQVFEFVCSSELIAENIKRELTNYTLQQINDLINDIFSNQVPEGLTLNIDALEINLGDISIENFGKVEMLDKFRTILTEKITITQNADPGITTANIHNGHHPAAYNTELEITKSFILHNDVPWWVDKSLAFDPDDMLNQLIAKSPLEVKLFLESQRSNKTIISRVAMQYKSSTRALITELVPGFFPTAINSKLVEDRIVQQNSIIDNRYPGHVITRLLSTYDQQVTTSIDITREFLIDKLFKSDIAQWLKHITLFNIIAADELLKLKTAISGSGKEQQKTSTKSKQQQLLKILENLATEQLEFLYLYVSENIEPYSHDEIESLLNINDDLQDYQSLNIKREEYNIIIDQPVEIVDRTAATSGQILKSDFDDPANDTEEINRMRVPGEPGLISDSADNIKPVNAGDIKSGRIDDINSSQEIIQPGRNISMPATGTDEIIFKNNDVNAAKNEDTIGIDQLSSGIIVDDIFYDGSGKPGSAGEIISWTETPEFTEQAKENKEITFLMKRLGSSNQPLLVYLKKLHKTDIKKLTKAFTRHLKKDNQHRKIVNNLLQHPYLLQYNLLQLFADLYFSETALLDILPSDKSDSIIPIGNRLTDLIKRIKLSQAHFLTVLGSLPSKEVIILKDIFQKQIFESTNEKRLVKKTLLKLPGDAVVVMDLLTRLPEDELLLLLEPAKAVAQNDLWTPEPGLANDEDGPKKFYIANAGLCLVAPYLPGLFNHLGYLENRNFKNKFVATRALFLLQYIATGSAKTFEHLLQFNKLLCGFKLEESIALNVRLTKKETAEADSLIESVIANWKVLRNTSVQGFRESMLQRKGIIFQGDLSWTLQVERKGHDMLLSTVPWSYNMIKLPWMKKMIQVEW